MTYTIFDLECDGFNPTKIYCLSAYIDGTIYTMTDYEDMRRYFSSYDIYIGHYISMFDIPVAERLLGIKIEGRLVDTWALSHYLFPTRNKHGLEHWGEEFGVPKPLITDWFSDDVAVYIHRCEEDVKINSRLWLECNKYLKKLYPNPDNLDRFLRYLMFKMEVAREQEEEGWLLDIEKTRTALAELEAEEKIRFDRLVSVMPKVPVRKLRAMPKVMALKDGSPSKNALGWYKLLADLGYSQTHEGPVEVVTGHEEPTPSSP
jgi:DNA polymerase III epsilon subunit-like protein